MNYVKFRDFSGKPISEIKLKDYSGYFYILDCEDSVKIGSTKNPRRRYKELYRHMNQYGNRKIICMYLSSIGTNYKRNETLFHRMLKRFQIKDTELYKISIDTALILGKKLKVVDESRKMAQKEKESMNNFNDFVNKMLFPDDYKVLRVPDSRLRELIKKREFMLGISGDMVEKITKENIKDNKLFYAKKLKDRDKEIASIDDEIISLFKG